jgi:hypothetical protein
LELSDEDLKKWWTRVELARTRRKRESDKWTQLMRGYNPPTDGTGADVNSNVHFRNTHLKIAELYAQFPDIKLEPLEPMLHLVDPQTGQPFMDPKTNQPMGQEALAQHIVAIKREVLNKKLGPDEANADLTLLEILFDLFQVSGTAFTKICYESDIKPIPPQTDASQAVPGAILGLSGAGGPSPQIPVVINERTRWYRISPKAGLIPHDYHSTDWDRAPFLGHEFEEPNTPQMRKLYNLPDDFKAFSKRDDLYILPGEKDPADAGSDVIRGVELFLHASLFDPNEANYDIFYRLVLIEGQRNKAAVYELCPYQTIGPDGKLTPDSMIGNPIHPFTLRVATDTAWIAADAAFTDPLVRQENTYLQQEIKKRDANIPRFTYPASLMEAIDKLKNMDTGQGVAIPDDMWLQFREQILAPIPHLESAQSDQVGHNILRRAMDETLGTSSPNTSGNVGTGYRSATETAIVQQNMSVRLKGERNILLQRIVAGVRKFDSLIMRYGSPGYVKIVGQSGAQTLQLFDRQLLSGRYAYDAHPDTMTTIDENTQRDNWLKWTNFMAKSPFLDQEQNARTGALHFGYDPSSHIKVPPPPQPPPPPPMNISLALKAADLGIPEVQIVMKDRGIDLTAAPPSPQLTAEMMREAAKSQPHGGAAPRADLLSEHTSQNTGAQDGRPPLAPAPPAMTVPGTRLQ